MGKVRAHEVLPGHFIDGQCPLEGRATIRNFFEVMNGGVMNEVMNEVI
jgi:hypothetical protein